MNVSLWRPMEDLSTINREMNDVVRDFFGKSEMAHIAGNTWTPNVNISENEDAYLIELDLPGIKKENVKINVKDKMLEIEGERKSEEEKKDINWIRKEVFLGKFQRSFSLPEDVNMDKIDAKFSEGVLQVSLLKKEETKPKEIAIKVK